MSARRNLIAALAEDSLGGIATLEDVARAEQLVDSHRTEVIAKAIGRLRAIPVTCTALTGPVWYGDGWNSAITQLEEIAEYQTPDDEAYPGELQRLRALVLGLRVAALRKEDLVEAQRLLADHEGFRKKATAAATIYAVRDCTCEESLHPTWCPASVPSDERITSIRDGAGGPLTPRELSWLKGAAARHELHVTGSRGGHWPLTDDLPGALLLVSQYLAAAVAVIERAGLTEEKATDAQSATATSQGAVFDPLPSYLQAIGQAGSRYEQELYAAYVQAITEVTRLQAETGDGQPSAGEAAAGLTVYRTSHDSIVMGLYTTAAAAREHCEAEERRSWAKFEGPTFDWIEDEEDGVAELTAWVGGEECTTGYEVTALEVASAYDEEADE